MQSSSEPWRPCNPEEKVHLRTYIIQERGMVLIGGAFVCCLSGAVEIDGHVIAAESDMAEYKSKPIGLYAVFSPPTESLRNIVPVETRCPSTIRTAQFQVMPGTELHGMLVSAREKKGAADPHTVVCLIDLSVTGFTNVASAAIPSEFDNWLGSFAGKDGLSFQAVHQKRSIRHINHYRSDWRAFCGSLVALSSQGLSISSETRKGHVVCIMGPKKSGKSTLGRYLVNSLLNQHERVAWIDLDVGRPEFTPSGAVSLTILSKPLLGPSYTHLTAPLRCVYFGDNTPVSNLTRYFECCEEVIGSFWDLVGRGLLDSAQGGKHIPVIINNCGITTEEGRDLMNRILRVSGVTHLAILRPPDSLDRENRSLIERRTEIRKLSDRERADIASREDAIYLGTGFQVTLDGLMKIPNVSYVSSFATHNYEIFSQVVARKFVYLFYMHQLIIPSPALSQQILATNRDVHEALVQGRMWWDFELHMDSKMPVCVHWHDIVLRIVGHQVSPALAPSAVSGMVVGLVEEKVVYEFGSKTVLDNDGNEVACPLYVDDTVPFEAKSHQLLGFAIMRSVDFEGCQYRLLTPFAPNQLSECNAIVRMARVDGLPESFYAINRLKEIKLDSEHRTIGGRVPGVALQMKVGGESHVDDILMNPLYRMRSKASLDTARDV